MSGEGLLPGSYIGGCLAWQKGQESFQVSFITALIPFMWTPPSGSNHLERPHLLTPSHCGLGFQHEFGGTETFSS